MQLRRPLEAEEALFRLKLYRSGSPIVVSDVLPLLEHMGARWWSSIPTRSSRGGPPLWIYDFDLQVGDVVLLDTGLVAELFQNALAQVWRGEMEDDGFNRLVLRGRIPWNDVAVLRAYAKYLRQTAVTFSQTYMETTLSAHPHIAARLVELFHARFDPAITDRDVVPELAAQVTVNIDDVISLDQDRILRSFLNLIMATLRTNAFQTTGDGDPSSTSRVQARPDANARAAPAQAPLRDLRLLTADRGRPPSRRQGGEGRNPLVGPTRTSAPRSLG